MHKDSKVWQPTDDRIHQANITQFIDHINRQGHALKNYDDLHQWSIEQDEKFWQEVWLFCDLIGSQGDDVSVLGTSHWQAPITNRDRLWFPDAQVNYAENLLSLGISKPK